MGYFGNDEPRVFRCWRRRKSPTANIGSLPGAAVFPARNVFLADKLSASAGMRVAAASLLALSSPTASVSSKDVHGEKYTGRAKSASASGFGMAGFSLATISED
jgi:hypothetical protein